MANEKEGSRDKKKKIMDQDVRTPSVLVAEQEQNMIQEPLPNGIIFVRDVLKSFGLTQVIQKLRREKLMVCQQQNKCR